MISDLTTFKYFHINVFPPTTDNSIQTLYQVEKSPDYFRDIPIVANNDLPVTIGIDGVPITAGAGNAIIYSLSDAPVKSDWSPLTGRFVTTILKAFNLRLQPD